MSRQRACILVVVLFAGVPAIASARSLAGSLQHFVTANGSIFAGSPVPDVLTPFLTRLATRGTALPAPSTVPGFTYRFNMELGAPEREPGSLGPVFLERGETLGRRRFALAVSYLDANLTDFDGRSLADQVEYSSDIDLGTRVGTTLDFHTLEVRAQIMSLSATYGVTDRWDVNVLLPLIHTTLEAGARQTGSVDGELILDDFVRLQEDAFGPGDVLLRTKYQLSRGTPLFLAAGLDLRAPTGSEDDFQGLGDWTITPSVVASRSIGPHDVHLNVGVEVNSDDLERSRGRYGAGVALQPLQRLAVLLDLIGSSSFVSDGFEITASPPQVVTSSNFLRRFQEKPPVREAADVRYFPAIPRSDIVDFAFGLKLSLTDRAVAFASVLVPIVDDGLRADVVPAAGLQYTF